MDELWGSRIRRAAPEIQLESSWNLLKLRLKKKSFQLEICLNSNWIFFVWVATTKLGYLAKLCGLDSSTTYS